MCLLCFGFFYVFSVLILIADWLNNSSFVIKTIREIIKRNDNPSFYRVVRQLVGAMSND